MVNNAIIVKENRTVHVNLNISQKFQVMIIFISEKKSLFEHIFSNNSSANRIFVEVLFLRSENWKKIEFEIKLPLI